jgi:hypothetical protein
MFKDLLTKERSKLWLRSKVAGTAETPSYGHATAWQAHDSADDRTTSGRENGASVSPTLRDVLATARTVSGM